MIDSNLQYRNPIILLTKRGKDSGGLVRIFHCKEQWRAQKNSILCIGDLDIAEKTRVDYRYSEFSASRYRK
jgi:hypothetical protein